MTIRWRLKWRQTKEFTRALSSALLNEPLKTMKVLASLPLMWLSYKLEHIGDDENPELQAVMENMMRAEYRTLKERLDQLPAGLQNFSNYFGNPIYSGGELSEIFTYKTAEDAIKLCDPHMKILISYGISLEDFYASLRGVPMLLDRLFHRHILNDSSRITLDRELKCADLLNVGLEIDVARMQWSIKFEIGMYCNENSQIGNGMWRWIYDLLSVRPYLFEGYEALQEGNALILIKSKYISETPFNADHCEKNRLDKLRWETGRV